MSEIANFDVKQIRKLGGLTQQELANVLGVAQPAISGVESGKNSANIDTIKGYADAMGIELFIVAKSSSDKTIKMKL